MEFFFDIRFLDVHFDAIVHFVATFHASSHLDADSFKKEFEAALKRSGAQFYPSQCYRIDNDLVLLENSKRLVEFMKSRSTSYVTVEQFFVEDPDQTRSLAENLTAKFFDGKNSTALIGKKFNLPARVLDKTTRVPLEEFYYFSVEHLIPL